MYATVSDADAYFSERLNTEVWDASTDDNKYKALIMATSAIDRLNFRGDSVGTPQFPRGSDEVVPSDIVYACAEIAQSLLDGWNPDLEFDNLRVTAQGYANVRSSYNTTIVPEHIAAGIPSIVAWRYLLPYLRDRSEVSLMRVN